MLLLLARHGNTFEAGEKAVWVGARTDLPLTGKGREQAGALATGLEPIKSLIKHVISGPLKRTREHAAIAAGQLGLNASMGIDERLCEIDYGAWEQKTSEEIEALGGGQELKFWNEQGQWPRSPGWTPSAEAIAGNVSKLAQELARDIAGGNAALLVTSNGILKFFLKLVPLAFDEMAAKGKLKVATGNCCALRCSVRGWEVMFWDRNPLQLAFDQD
jgi:broad specificity phosphatase PhoE